MLETAYRFPLTSALGPVIKPISFDASRVVLDQLKGFHPTHPNHAFKVPQLIDLLSVRKDEPAEMVTEEPLRAPTETQARSILQTGARLVEPLATLLTLEESQWRSVAELVDKLGSDDVPVKDAIDRLRNAPESVKRAYVKLFIFTEILSLSQESGIETSILELEFRSSDLAHRNGLIVDNLDRIHLLSSVLESLDSQGHPSRGER